MVTTRELDDIYGNFIVSFKKPLNIDFTKGITKVPPGQDAYILKDPTSSTITIEKTESGGVLVRYAFSYDCAVNILGNYKEGLRFLSVVQNQMVTAISPWIDWSKDVPNLFQRSGMPNRFFIESQSHASFEIRAYYNG